MLRRLGLGVACWSVLLVQGAGPAFAQYAPPPPEPGTPPPGGYAPPPPGGGYAPPPPGGGYAPPPPPATYGRPQPGYGQNQGYAAVINCESRRGDYRRCAAPNNRGRVEQLSQRGNECRFGETWGFDANTIWVTGGCNGRFGYGYTQTAYPPTYPGYPNQTYPPQQTGGFAGRLECESRNFRFQRCSAPTQNRVVLLRQTGGQCVQGQTWGFDMGSIWTTAGCRAEFGFGYGREMAQGGGGPSAGAVIGGVAIAAGLAALLSRSGRKPEAQRTDAAVQPARLVADTSRLPRDQRAAADLCLAEAARQVGATGGRELTVVRLADVLPRGQGYSVAAFATATYPDAQKPLSMDCRTEGGRIAQLDFK